MSIESRNESIRKAYAKKHIEWENNLKQKVSKEILEEYYKNHSRKEACDHFQLPLSSMMHLLDMYGIKHTNAQKCEFRKKANIEKHGSYEQYKSDIKAKREATCLERYGATSNLSTDEFREQSKKSCIEKYGTEYANQANSVKKKIADSLIAQYGSKEKAYESFVEKSMHTREERYGSIKQSYLIGLENQSKVIQEKYGVAYACMRKEARNLTNNSTPNRQFAQMLDELNIVYDREFPVKRYSYDFKVDNILIEINPSATHNSTWGIFGIADICSPDYHLKKLQTAKDAGFRCINVWDWDDKNKIAMMLLPKRKIYARDCKIEQLDAKTANKFLRTYHLQNACQKQLYCYGLYHNGDIVQVMTFGKPRYNKQYDYELLRLATKFECYVIGGAEKLFSHFIKQFESIKIISYCDNSKFNGDVYERLGFTKINDGKPSLHWYNITEDKHYTDNFLRQRGADQLLGTSFGKGTNNEEIMRQYKFVEIYDCGQSTYSFTKEKISYGN